MSYRFMRVIVMFDLPVVTRADRKSYRCFRRFLVSSGFVMMQESIYTKLALNNSVAIGIQNNIRKNKPKKGLVQMMTITERQFSDIEFVVGNIDSDVITSTERYIEL